MARNEGSSRRRSRLRTRLGSIIASATAAAVAVSGCAVGGDQKVASSAPAKLSGTISLWHHYSDREARVYQSAVDGFEKANPGVHVKVHSNQEDTKITQVLSSGGDIDVMIVNINDTLGTLCKSMTDLAPYMSRDKVPESDFQPTFAKATTVNNRHCALPTTSDVNGLYYNTDLLKAAGYTSPPKTLDELESMALKMTTYNPDGSIKTLGFDPLIGFDETSTSTLGAAAGASWLKGGKAATDSPEWQKIIQWQKAFVDKIGYKKLKTFSAGLGDEFSANNPFQKGKIAMALDGEWRVAFIQDQAPKLHYATAPAPVLSGSPAHYGGGAEGGAAIGINARSKNQELAWALVKYLTANTSAAVGIANGLKNIPTLKSAAASSDLQVPEQYKTFVTVSASPYSTTTPVTALGATLTAPMDQFWEKYQQGNGTGLEAGLKSVTKQINDALSLRQAK